MAKTTKHYAEVRFGQIHYRRAEPSQPKNNPPLMMFHMSPNSGRIYETFLGKIGESRLCIAPDTPGFGDSSPPSHPPTINNYADAMGDLIDALKLRSVDVMGYHTGAEICVALALARPEQICKVILISAPIFTDAELHEFRAHYTRDQLTQDGSHLAKKWRGHLHWAGPGWTMAYVAEQFNDALRNPSIAWWGHNAAFNFDMAEALKRVKQQVLVFNPDDDLHTQTCRAAPLMKNGRIDHLQGWGHGFLDVHTTAACAKVCAFLDDGR